MLPILSLLLLTQPADATEPATSPVVLELFTSEGCSSCPPADKLAAAIVEKQRDDVLVLAYHVDYWDRLGWTDRFGSPDFTARQRGYAKSLGHGRVYTPQMVVDGQLDAVGSDSATVLQHINTRLKSDRAQPLAIEVARTDDTVSVTLPEGERAEVMLVQSGGQSDVKRGENAGRQLTHVNIVRAMDHGRGTLTLDVPADAEGELFVVALQRTRSGHVAAVGRAAVAAN